MVWQKKASAPTSFNTIDATIASVTGDATWSWLVNWLPLIPPVQWDTAAFCAQGPTGIDPLAPEDFMLVNDPRARAGAVSTALFLTKISMVAYDRLFGAYCETPDQLVAGYGAQICTAVSSSHGGFGTQNEYAYIQIPPTATAMRFKATNYTGSVSNVVTRRTGTGYSAPYDAEHAATPGGAWYNDSFAAGVYSVVTIHIDGGPGTAQVCVQFNVPGAGTPYTPTPQPQPLGVAALVRTPVPATLVGIADELRRLETKMELAVQFGAAALVNTLDTGITSTTSEPIEGSEEIDASGAIGAIIFVNNLPTDMIIQPGSPTRFARVGRVDFGNDDGWYPSVEIEHSPLIIRPLPPGCEKVTCSVYPPVTVTVQLIYPSNEAPDPA